jgi:hypothetical protein
VRRPLLALALATVAALSGCSSGPRKPLFGGPDDTPRAPDPVPQVPARGELGSTREAGLIARLRAARTVGERKALADELVARGPSARPLLIAAIDEEGLLIDLLEDVLRRIDEAEAKTSPPKVADARAVESAWADRKHTLALDRYHNGDTYGAMRIIDAILALEPDASCRPKLLRLLRRCRDRLLRESVLTADLLPGARTTVPSEVISARVRLTNLSREEIRLKVEGGTLGAVTVDYEELGPDGRHTLSRTERRVAVEGDLTLKPGQSLEVPVEIGRPHAKLPDAVVGRVHLNGRLRAHTMFVGDSTYPFFVPLLPTQVVVVHPSQLALAKDPRAAFEAAVAEAREAGGEALGAAVQRLFVSALLVAGDEAAAGDPTAAGAVDLAAQALQVEGTRGPLSDGLCAALARITGEPLGFTRQEWLWWWRSKAARPEPGRE